MLEKVKDIDGSAPVQRQCSPCKLSSALSPEKGKIGLAHWQAGRRKYVQASINNVCGLYGSAYTDGMVSCWDSLCQHGKSKLTAPMRYVPSASFL